jgi:WD40 repeat protein
MKGTLTMKTKLSITIFVALLTLLFSNCDGVFSQEKPDSQSESVSKPGWFATDTERVIYETKKAQEEMKTWEPNWESVVKKINDLFDKGTKLVSENKRGDAKNEYQKGLTIYESVKKIKNLRDDELKNYKELTQKTVPKQFSRFLQKTKETHEKIESNFNEQLSHNNFNFGDDILKKYENTSKRCQEIGDILSDSHVQFILNLSQSDNDFLQKWDRNKQWQKTKKDYLDAIEKEDDLAKIKEKIISAYDLCQKIKTDYAEIDKARKSCEVYLPKADATADREILEHFGYPEWKEANERLEKVDSITNENEAITAYTEITKLLREAKAKANTANDAWRALQVSVKKTDTKSWKKYDSANFEQFQKVFSSLEKNGLDATNAIEQCKKASEMIDQSFSIIVTGLIREKKNSEALDLILSGQNEFRSKLKGDNPDDQKLCDELVLNTPDWWIKSLIEIKELKPTIDASRYVQLMEFADTSKNDTTYNEMRKLFFKTLKSKIADSDVRIGFVADILPSMIRRKNFDGLKEAMTDIDVMMEQPKGEYNFNGRTSYVVNCLYLSGFARAMGDRNMAEAYSDAGWAIDGQGSGLAYRPTHCQVTFKWLPRAIALEDINIDEVFSQSPNETMTHSFCSIGIHLAQKGDLASYTKFAMNVRKLKYFKSYAEYHLARADAIIGEFDRARLNWKKYPTRDTGHWSHVLLSFIIQREFLAGEFRGWESMTNGEKEIHKLQTVYKGSDFSQYVSRFYFNYGRGLARHKTGVEIFQEYEKLRSTLNATDLAFFMAGVATGSQDRKNPKQEPEEPKTTSDVSSDDNVEKPITTGHVLQSFGNFDYAVTCVAVSPDGKIIASGGMDNAVKLWDVATGEQLLSLSHAKPITSVCFSPSGNEILSTALDGSVKLSRTEDGEGIRSFNMSELIKERGGRGGDSNIVAALSSCFSPNGQYMVIGVGPNANGFNARTPTSRCAAFLFSIKDQSIQPRSFLGHHNIVTSVSISPDNRKLLTASYDKTAILWDIETGEQIRIFQGHTGEISNNAQFSGDGTRIVTTSLSKKDNTARIWDVKTGAEVRTFSAGNGYMRYAVLSPNGKILATTQLNIGNSMLTHPSCTLKLWDAKGKELFSKGIDIGTFQNIPVTRFLPDGKSILVGGKTNSDEKPLQILAVCLDDYVLSNVSRVVTDQQSTKENLARDKQTEPQSENREVPNTVQKAEDSNKSSNSDKQPFQRLRKVKDIYDKLPIPGKPSVPIF